MDDATLEAFVRQNIQADSSGVAEFIWQGGEPTLMGIDYFEKALALQQRYRGNRQINNYLQTNGMLLDDSWARFLKNTTFWWGFLWTVTVSVMTAGVRPAQERAAMRACWPASAY